MLKNYLKIAIRNLLKNKMFSMINITGLSLGIVSSFMILIYVGYEFSYDRFHEHADQLYRIHFTFQAEGTAAIVQPSLGPTVKATIPEVKDYIRIYMLNNHVLHWNDQALRIEQLFCTDASFLEHFSVNWLKGNRQQALSSAQSVVLSASTAKQLFGDEDPIGQTIWRNRDMSYIVTGVFEDFPQNAHFHPRVLFSYEMLYEGDSPAWFKAEGWDYIGYHTYLLLDEKADPMAVADKITHLAQPHLSEDLKGTSYQLMNVKDIHLHAHIPQELFVSGHARQVYILLFVAMMILLIANINYMNLTTSRATERAKEVGVRKLMGVGKHKLFIQFMGENFLMSILTFVLAVTLLQILLPSFTELAGIPYDFIDENISLLLFILLALFFFNTLLSGIYPASLIAAYSPLSALKSNFNRNFRGVGLRKVLVVFQFCISLALLVFTFTVREQVFYMQNEPLGVDIEQTLVMRIQTSEQNFEYFSNHLAQQLNIQGLTLSTEVPSKRTRWEQDFESRYTQKVRIGMIWVDDAFIDQYQIALLAGRNFSEDLDKSEKAVILNKTAAEMLEFTRAEQAIGENITWTGRKEDFQVVGVMEDYHHISLHQSVEPLLLIYRDTPMRYVSAKIAAQDYKTTLSTLAALWKEIYPDTLFEYFFLDDAFQAQYLEDQKLEKFMTLFSVLAILVACMGLLGLASITVIQRTKEIGIRKVLGASVQSIIGLLSKDFIKLVLIASVLALPIAYWAMHRWLKNYAFRIEITWWLLAAPVVLVLLLALVTVCVQTIKTALTNPAKSLRYE